MGTIRSTGEAISSWMAACSVSDIHGSDLRASRIRGRWCGWSQARFLFVVVPVPPQAEIHPRTHQAAAAMDGHSVAGSRAKRYNRAYQACINCRRRKIKCIIGNDEHGRLQASCTRCQRELRHCTFTADRGGANASGLSRTVFVASVASAESHSLSRGNQSEACQSASSPMPRTHEDVATAAAASSNGLEQSPANLAVSTPEMGSQQDGPNQGSAGQAAVDPLISIAGYNGSRSGSSRPASDVADHHDEQWLMVRHILISPEETTLGVWAGWHFVQTGLLTSQEAVTYVDLFFRNMAILSPIVYHFYRNHDNHHILIHKDPVLCCTIVALSARHHLLASEGGLSRGYHIHDRLWQHCQSTFHRVIWDEARVTKDQLRYLGTIESMLLATEWHPRSSHLPISEAVTDMREAEDVNDETTLSSSKGRQFLELQTWSTS